MSTTCINSFLNALSGTSQEDRTAAAPNPASVQLNDLSWEDLLREQELATNPETKMERHSWEIRSKLIGFNLA